MTFDTPDGFQNTDPSADDFHGSDGGVGNYPVVAKSPLDAASTREWVRNNPTPGSPNPATSGGTQNDASGGMGLAPLTSIVSTNQVTGNEVVVNVTAEGHILGNGVVIRETLPNADGTSRVVNYGEGN